MKEQNKKFLEAYEKREANAAAKNVASNAVKSYIVNGDSNNASLRSTSDNRQPESPSSSNAKKTKKEQKEKFLEAYEKRETNATAKNVASNVVGSYIVNGDSNNASKASRTGNKGPGNHH